DHAVDEIVLSGIAAHILERQDGDRRLVGAGARPAGSRLGRLGWLRDGMRRRLRYLGDIAHEPYALPGEGSDEALRGAVVADRPPRRIEPRGDRRIRDDPPLPD